MIVVDAAAWVTALVDRGRRGAAVRAVLGADDDWAAPGHSVLEVLRTLLRYERAGLISADAAARLVATVGAAGVRYFPVDGAHLADIWNLRTNVSTYDAPYVVLARSLEVPLVTVDVRLARAVRAIGVDSVVPGAG